MKAKVKKPFIDKKEGVTRNVGDIFSLSKKRYEEINSTKFGKLVDEVAEETNQPKKSKSNAKKPTKKAGD